MVNNRDFIQRLEKIHKEYELSAAAFADKIQVGRATISHILSGRNKPSLDFVMKIVHTFPQVDWYWLLEGKGDFPKLENQNTFPTATDPKQQNQKVEQEINQNINEPHLIANSISENSTSNKKIKRIIIFMEDGTFESYETP